MQVFFARFTKERSILNNFTVLYKVRLQYRVDKALKWSKADTYSCKSNYHTELIRLWKGVKQTPIPVIPGVLEQNWRYCWVLLGPWWTGVQDTQTDPHTVLIKREKDRKKNILFLPFFIHSVFFIRILKIFWGSVFLDLQQFEAQYIMKLGEIDEWLILVNFRWDSTLKCQGF